MSVVSPDGIDVVRVAKAFGDTEVLSGFELEVKRGRFVSIIGPSGCGKSTLLRIIGGLIQPDAGTVSIFGESTRCATEQKHIGFVPQSPALMAWRTVLQNVRLPLEVNRKSERVIRDPEALLSSFGLGHVLDRLPHELSGGMAQRVAIARAFCFEPSLLLMDEPFSSLDELTRETLRYELLQRCDDGQKTVLFVTHSVTEAVLLSDRVVVMSPVAGEPPAVVDIPLARPRYEGVELSEDFRHYERVVRSALRRGTAVRNA